MLDDANALPRRVLNALLWLAAFCFASGIFLSATLLLRGLPPTAPVAVGRVTIEKVSKLRDYATAALFFIVVPIGTILLHRLGARQEAALRRALRWRRGVDVSGSENVVSLLFILPFFLAPFLYLTTFKWGWPLLIPLLFSQLAPRAVIAWQRSMTLRRLFARELVPFHSLIAAEAFAWMLARYVATGKRIAHVPTLFLEIVFVGFFVAAIWGALLLIARLASFTFDIDLHVALQRLSIAALPLLLLPPLAILFVPAPIAISVVMLLMIVSLAMALRGRAPVDPRAVRNLVAFAIVPLLLYCFSYASTAALTQWIDLFHRGEALGPASDYLRGKVPYRDVFVLHGLLEDGQLDAWLMQLFGRNVEIALARPVVLGSFAVPALWYLGMVLFESMPLAALVVLLGAVTTVDNERAFFEIAAVALLLAGIQRRAAGWTIAAGIVSGIALFFSFDIGLYSIVGGLAFAALAAFLEKSARRQIVFFAGGVLLGCAPFAVYLAMRGAFGAFVETSFVTIPRIIDAIWSLPFPDLTTTFRKNLNLHTISDFLLFEHFRFILNPLVIVIALLALVQRWLTKRIERLDVGLAALTIFAVLTQRSALGRADFTHQYFSAFLIGPMIVALLVLVTRGSASTWRSGNRAAQAFAIVTAMAILPLFVVALWVPDIANARLDDTVRYQGRVSRFDVDPAAQEIRNRIDQVRYHIFELTKKGAPIFDFSNQPAFYFLCDRPNPTRFYQVPILSPPSFQRETILALERAKPPLVIRRSPQEFDTFDGIDNAIRAQAVAAYIDDHYEFARTARGVEVWQRRKDAPARLNLDGYMRQIRIPTAKELGVIGARARLVFPAIGSLHGATDNYWQSDLMLHNPLKETTTLRLRYVAGDVHVDRGVQLAPGQSIRFEDVVKSFFHAPEGRGVLWIEYRGARPPLVRVKTYDAAHPSAKASIDTPLSASDAAAAQSDTSDLAILGIPAGDTNRRINIGAVNTGAIPSTVRITVRTRTGQQIGGTIEQGLPEDESFQLTDAESALGVKLDETTTIHVTMIAGSGVAYASVTTVTGDTQFLPAVPSPEP